MLKPIEFNNFEYAGLYYCSSTLAPEVDLFQTHSPYVSTHSSHIDPAGYQAACYIYNMDIASINSIAVNTGWCY